MLSRNRLKRMPEIALKSIKTAATPQDAQKLARSKQTARKQTACKSTNAFAQDVAQRAVQTAPPVQKPPIKKRFRPGTVGLPVMQVRYDPSPGHFSCMRLFIKLGIPRFSRWATGMAGRQSVPACAGWSPAH